MHKGIVFIAAIASSFGALMLVACLYHCVVFGDGDPEIGNFNRYEYFTSRDPVSGETSRSWMDPPTGEGSPIAFVNMWAVGLVFFALGPAICVWEYAGSGQRRFG